MKTIATARQVGLATAPSVLYCPLASGFHLVSRRGLSLMESSALARFPWLVHGFSLRRARHDDVRQTQDFNLGITPQAQPSQVEQNRRRFVNALDADAALASLRQTHSATVWQVVRAPDSTGSPCGSPLEYRPAGWPLPKLPAGGARGPNARSRPSPPLPGEDPRAGDALVTSEPGLLLSVRVADCLPVLLVDRRLRVIAAIHAGWRGALARVIEKTAGELRRLAGSRPDDLVAALGPAIGPCCYEVGEEVIDAFRGRFAASDAFFRKPALNAEVPRPDRHTLLFHTQAPPGHRRERANLHLDLPAVARSQLLAAGLKPSAIHASGYCTACHAALFFSHRREGASAGRMMAAIGVVES